MPLLRLGLNVSAVMVVIVSVASWLAGYTMEVALLRGLLMFPLVAFVGFFAELVVSTASPAERGKRTSDGESGEQEQSTAGEPIDLAQVRAEQDALAERQAA